MLRVAQSQICILGPEVDALERSLERYLGVKHAIGVSSGTDALTIAFMALEIGVGDEVLVPTFSFFATAGCVSRTGATPVFVDVDPVSFNIEPSSVRKAITSKTKAIVPVHLFGQAADMNALMQISRETGIPIIEDAAQAIGTQTSDGTRVGGIGTIGCFSFYPTKNLGAFGDAGLVTTNDDALAVKIKMLRNHGMEPRYHHQMVGGNFRIDALQAAVLSVKLPHLPSWHEGRRKNAALYTKHFIEQGLATRTGATEFSEQECVLLPAAVNEGTSTDHHIFNQYTIRVQRRDELRAHLQQKGIGTEIYYPIPFHRQECYADMNCVDADFPVSNALAESVISLPIYPELTPAQIEEVVVTVNEFERTSPLVI